MLGLGGRLPLEHSRLTGNVPCHEHGGVNEGVYTFTQNPSNRTLKMGVFYCMKISLNKVLKQKLKKRHQKLVPGVFLWVIDNVCDLTDKHQTVSPGYSREDGLGKRDERNAFSCVLLTLCPSYK